MEGDQQMQQQLSETPAGSTNLIVKYMPNSYTAEDLIELFKPYGKVEGAKIIKNKVTQISLGYGFVTFANESDAESAVKALDMKKIGEREIKVSISKPRDKNANLYVAGLEPNYTTDDLRTIFQVYGKVIEVKILTDKVSGQSKGVGFVRYETSDEAQVAAQALNGVTLAGTTKALTVRNAERKDQRVQNMMAGMMGGAAGGMRFNPLANMYGMYGNFGYGGGAPGFGGQGMGAQGLGAQGLGQAPGAAGNTFSLFVYNLPPETDDAYLFQLFGPYGAVSHVKIIRDMATQKCKGFGFVHMLKMEDAQVAIQALNGAQIGNKQLQVSFKKDK